MTASSTSSNPVAEPKHGFKQILRSYFYWTYSRGSFHYDIMVTLILLFIFVTPHLWDFGAKPSLVAGPLPPFQVVASERFVIVTVQASDADIPPGASYREVKRGLRNAVEPVCVIACVQGEVAGSASVTNHRLPFCACAGNAVKTLPF